MTLVATFVVTVMGGVLSILITDAIRDHRNQKKWHKKRR